MENNEIAMKLGKIIRNKNGELVLMCPVCNEEIQIRSCIPTRDGRHYSLDCPKCKIEVEIDINELRHLKKQDN